MGSNRILIYDTEGTLGRRLPAELAKCGVEALWCGHLATAQAMLEQGGANVLLALPCVDGRGIDLVAWVRERGMDTPVLVATPAEELELRVKALDLGACDYLVQPFDAVELVARIETVQMRGVALGRRMVQRGRLTLDVEVGHLGDGVRSTRLTRTERQLFSVLMEHRDRPVSKRRLKDALGASAELTDNAVEVTIHRLRAKARDVGLNIRTYRGFGYQLEGA